MEGVPLEIGRGISFEHDEAPPHFRRQVTAYLYEHYGNSWIGRRGPVTWPPRSPDLTPLDFSLQGRMKEMIYRTKVHTREELLHRIMDAAAYTRTHRNDSTAVNSCLERARLCIGNRGGHS
jgi:hypothetical protein